MVAHVAGAGGPAVSILTGITAEAATARLAAPLGDAARLCEVVGILWGLATGMHLVVVACANRLAHDQLGRALAEAFEQMIDPGPASLDRAVSERRGVQAAGRADEQVAEAPVADRGAFELAKAADDALRRVTEVPLAATGLRNGLTARRTVVDGRSHQ